MIFKVENAADFAALYDRLADAVRGRIYTTSDKQTGKQITVVELSEQKKRTRKSGLNYNSKSERLRYQVIELRDNGCSIKQISDTLKLSSKTISKILNKYSN